MHRRAGLKCKLEPTTRTSWSRPKHPIPKEGVSSASISTVVDGNPLGRICSYKIAMETSFYKWSNGTRIAFMWISSECCAPWNDCCSLHFSFAPHYKNAHPIPLCTCLFVTDPHFMAITHLRSLWPSLISERADSQMADNFFICRNDSYQTKALKQKFLASKLIDSPTIVHEQIETIRQLDFKNV